MAELSRDEVIEKVKAGKKLERADLKGIDLSKALLENADFRRADLEGTNLEGAKLRKANLRSASLREAFLQGADLRDANLDKADLEGANLTGANLSGANLGRANLEGANLAGANLSGAKLENAQLDSADLGMSDLSKANVAHADLVEAYLGGATLVGADFSGAKLEKADLSGADARDVTLTRAKLGGSNWTGAKIANIAGTGSATNARCEWADVSPAGDGSRKIEAAEAESLLSGVSPASRRAGGNKRYFGKGDVLRNAVLEFGDGAQVEIESRFEGCAIALGKGTELVIGKDGVLAQCRITGAGNITIHGKFFEKDTPGIVGPSQLVVSSQGAVVSGVEQNAGATRFAFEPGCRLRMTIQKPRANQQQGER